MDSVQEPVVGQAGIQGNLSCEHSQQEWEAQRELLTRLYMDEDKKLPEVRSIMADQHGFNATLCIIIPRSSLNADKHAASDSTRGELQRGILTRTSKRET